jgi:hypothetical protein
VATVRTRRLHQSERVLDLPDPQPEVAYVVSRLLASALPDRDDLFFPGLEVRDSEGHILGCRWLGTLGRSRLRATT